MKSRIELLLVALVCLGPVAGAYLLYYGGDPAELPRLSNPERRLLERPVELPSLPGRADGAAVDDLLSGPTWSLIHARTSRCEAACLEHLVRLRQVHLALGRDEDRVQRVYIGPGGESAAGRDPTLVVAAGFEGPAGGELLELLQRIGHAPGHEGRVYVVDPHGNLVMSYPPDPDQEGLLDDLERLLSVSRIG